MKSNYLKLSQSITLMLLSVFLFVTPLQIKATIPTELNSREVAVSEELTVTLTTSSDEVKTITEALSLEDAIIKSHFELSKITMLEITSGSFTTNDWIYLQEHKFELNFLSDFVITETISSLEEIPNTAENRYFGINIKNISIAKLTKIGAYIFRNCPVLQTATFPLVTTIGEGAFSNCPNLQLLTLGPTAPTVADDAFVGCFSKRYLFLVDENGERMAIDDCPSYELIDDKWQGFVTDNYFKITIKKTEKGKITIEPSHYVGENEKVTITYLSDSCYLDYTTLKVYKTGDETKEVQLFGDHQFMMPAYEVTIEGEFKEKTLTVSIDHKRLSSGRFLEDAIKKSNYYIGGIKNLEIIAGAFNTCDWNYLKQYKDELYTSDIIITESVSNVQDIPKGPCFGIRLKNISIAKVNKIGESAFSCCLVLETINFPVVTFLDKKAFYQCISLKTVNFPLVTMVGDYAFYNCSSLDTITFPLTTIIGNDGFSGCSVLRTANFPLVTTIGNRAFKSCSVLQCANFPLATMIGDWGFLNCIALQTANFPLVRTLGTDAFSGCEALQTANFPLATTVGQNVFSNCFALQTANFPLATTIGNYAFYNCFALKNANIPLATTIKDEAFCNCTTLHSANFPRVTTIEEEAFYNCSALHFANFPHVTTIEDQAFYNCSDLKVLVLGKTSPRLGIQVFKNCPTLRYLIVVDENGEQISIRDCPSYKLVGSKWNGFITKKQFYRITFCDRETGTIISTLTTYANQGDVISLDDLSANGSYFITDNLKVYKTGDKGTMVTVNSDHTFVMPAFNITVEGDFDEYITETKKVLIKNDVSIELVKDGFFVYSSQPSQLLSVYTLMGKCLLLDVVGNGEFVNMNGVTPGFYIIWINGKTFKVKLN